MAENLLENFEVNEQLLEEALFDIEEDHDWDWVGRHLHGSKQLAIQRAASGSTEDFPSPNNFVKMNYIILNGKSVVYPSFTPSTELDAEIKGYKPIFAGNCSIVLGRHNEKDFIFFDPDAKNKDYERLLSTKQRIKLAAISSGSAYTDIESDLGEIFNPEQLRKFLDIGYVKTRLPDSRWRFPLYTTIFQVKYVKQRYGNHFLVEAENPLNNQNFDLITASREFDTTNLERIASDFYFIGRF